MEDNNIKNEKGYCTVYTKFMQNYRLSKPIEMGEQLQSIRNTHELDDFFCLRTDGYVESFYHEKESSTGYDSVALDLHGALINSVICDNGDIIVFASQVEELFYSIKRKDKDVFEPLKKVDMELPYQSIKIANFSVRKIGSEVWIAVIMQTGVGDYENDLHVLLGKWQNEDTVLKCTSITVSSSKCCWLLSDPEDPVIAFYGDMMIGVHALSGKIENYPSIPIIGSCTDIYSSFDPGTNADIISVIIDKQLYIFNTAQNQWIKYTDSADFKKVRLHYEKNTGIHIIALDSASTVYHGFFITSDSTFSVLSPIISDKSDFCISDCNGEVLSVLCIEKQKVSQMILESSSSNWNIQEIGLKTENDIYEYKSYMTEITAYDPCGLTYPNANISIWSNEETRVEINGKSVMIGPDNKFSCCTNENGMAYIAQETCMLSIPEIYVSFADNLKNGKNAFEADSVVAISQYSPVQNVLKDINADKLLNAKKNDGTPLLADKYRDKETAEGLAEALKECVGLIPQTKQNNNYLGEARWIKHDEITSHGKIVPTTTLRNSGGWSLKKEGNKLTYSLKSQEEIALLLQKADEQNAIVGKSFFSRIGDFFRSVVDKVVEVVEVVVTVVKDTVKTVITYVKDKVKYLFTQIVETAQQVWDVVESVFNEVKVFFTDVFKWLGYIFNWNDILRTKKTIDYCVDQLFECADVTLEYAESKVVSCLEYLKDKISEASEMFLKKLDPNTSFGSMIQGDGKVENQKEMEYNLSNNFIYDQYVYRDIPAISQNESSMSIELYDSFEDEKNEFLDILEEFAKDMEQNKAFEEAYNYFSDVFSGRDNMFKCMLSGLIKVFEGLAVTVVSAAKAVVTATFEICRKLVQAMYKLMTAEIKLPFLSTLFSMITKGDKLTVSGVFSLIIALPVTVVHKIVKQKAPIADDAEFDEFKKYINAEKFKNAICGNSTSPMAKNAGACIAPDWVQDILNVVNGITSFFYYNISAVMDMASIGNVEMPLSVNIGCFVCEAIWTLASAVCWFGDPSAAEWVNYSLVCVGLILDLVCLICEQTMPENHDDAQRIATVIYGAVFEITGIIALVFPEKTPGACDYLLNIVPPLVCCTKLGLLSSLIASTEGVSGAVPVIGGFAAAVTVSLASVLKIKGNSAMDNDGALLCAPI